jgi:hypothetical protein
MAKVQINWKVSSTIVDRDLMTDGSMPRPHDRFPRCDARHRQQPELRCQLPAGWGTSHPGSGRCKHHGGSSRITHGRYSTITRPAIQARLDALKAADPDPLDLLEKLHLLRSLLGDWLERYETYREALLAWHAAGHPDDGSRPRQLLEVTDAGRLIERIARVAETVHKLREQHTISLETFRRLMEQMALVVTRYVSDGDTLRAIEQAWGEIRVEPGRLDRRERWTRG